MKKRLFLLPLLFLFMASVLFVNQFFQEKDKQFGQLVTAGQADGARDVLFTTGSYTDQQAYLIFSHLLDQLDGNLYCFDMEEVAGQPVYTKYIYAHNLDLFANLPLSDGRFFYGDEKESDLFVSTQRTNDPNQIGRICGFAKDNHFQIKTLKNGVDADTQLFRKNFSLYLKNPGDFAVLQQQLNQRGIYMSENAAYAYTADLGPFVSAASLAAILVLALILFYHLLNSYKEIGIEKMLGTSPFAIWKKRILPIAAGQAACFAVVFVTCTLLLFDSFNAVVAGFLGGMAVLYLLVFALTIAALSLPFIYVRQISILKMLKNKRPTRAIIGFNAAVKVALSVALICILSASYTQIALLTAQNNDRFGNWIAARQYASAPLMSTRDENFDWDSQEVNEKFKKIYREFNQSGAVLAEFDHYIPGAPVSPAGFPYNASITINPNYLRLFPVRDADGNPVDFSERDTRQLWLVPVQYKDRQDKILEMAENGKLYEEGKPVEQETAIIWIQDNQDFFSFRPDVNPQNQNCVRNPIVSVLTEANSWEFEHVANALVIGRQFLIKVSDYTNPEPDLNAVFGKYFDLSRQFFPIESVYQTVNDQMEMANRLLQLYAILAGVLILLIISIISQNVFNYFEQNKRRLAIQQFMGYKRRDKYKSYFVLLFASFGVTLAGALLFSFSKETLFFSLALLALELLLSGLQLAASERKNTLQIIKEG